MSYLLARSAQASGDYVGRLTYLLFLKMADERRSPPWNQKIPTAQEIVEDLEAAPEQFREIVSDLGSPNKR